MNLEKDLEKIKEILKTVKYLSFDQITSLLEWSPKKRKDNKAIILSWVDAGELLLDKKNRITAIEDSSLYAKGIFRIIKNKFGFVDSENSEERNGIYIARENFNSALDGDRVLVKITNEGYDSKGKPGAEGEIIKIIERRKNTVVGILEKNKKFSFVLPTSAFGSDIYIPNSQVGNADNKDIVVAEIDHFSDEAMQEVREVIKKKIDYTDRKDLTELPIITIDGADAKDLDDAVYVEKLKNGNYRLIVAIADVSYYVKKDSTLDLEARNRGNSVYLVDRVLPMFPKEISNGICSLNEREDKRTNWSFRRAEDRRLLQRCLWFLVSMGL